MTQQYSQGASPTSRQNRRLSSGHPSASSMYWPCHYRPLRLDATSSPRSPYNPTQTKAHSALSRRASCRLNMSTAQRMATASAEIRTGFYPLVLRAALRSFPFGPTLHYLQPPSTLSPTVCSGWSAFIIRVRDGSRAPLKENVGNVTWGQGVTMIDGLSAKIEAALRWCARATMSAHRRWYNSAEHGEDTVL